MFDHPALQKGHTLPARRARATASFIPLPPSFVPCEFCERCTRPTAHVEFVKPGCDFHCAVASIGNDGRRLQCPSLGARLYRRATVLPEYLCRVGHLLATEIIELHARHAATKDAVNQSVVPVTDQMDVQGHASIHVSFSMNCRVRSRAS